MMVSPLGLPELEKGRLHLREAIKANKPHRAAGPQSSCNMPSCKRTELVGIKSQPLVLPGAKKCQRCDQVTVLSIQHPDLCGSKDALHCWPPGSNGRSAGHHKCCIASRGFAAPCRAAQSHRPPHSGRPGFGCGLWPPAESCQVHGGSHTAGRSMFPHRSGPQGIQPEGRQETKMVLITKNLQESRYKKNK